MTLNLAFPQGQVEAPLPGVDFDHVHRLVLELSNPDRREEAMHELSKKREDVPDLAPILWYSFGTIACLLQEIVAVYPLLSPPRLKPTQSTRVCNALALLQCVASHRDTRTLFLNGMYFIYSFSPLRYFVDVSAVPDDLLPFAPFSRQ